MRHTEMLLVATVVIFTCVDASSLRLRSVSAKETTPDQHRIHAQRFLRDDTNTGEEEERWFGINLSGIQKFARSIKHSKFVKFVHLWILKLLRKSADGAFAYLGLGKAGHALVASPHFETWVKYLTKTNKENPYGPMVASLVSRYDDESLTRILEAAKKVDSMNDIVTQLQGKIKPWIDKRLSGDDAFALLELDKVGDKLFASPRFKTWVRYMTKTNKVSLYRHILHVLGHHYEAQHLARMLAAARKVYGANYIVAALQNAQMTLWVNGGLSVNIYFKYLGLDQGLNTFLSNPGLDVFIAFASKASSSRNNRDILPINVFRDQYGDMPLAVSLEMSRKTAKTKTMAKEMQLALFHEWKREGATPFDILRSCGKGQRFAVEAEVHTRYRSFYFEINKKA